MQKYVTVQVNVIASFDQEQFLLKKYFLEKSVTKK